MDAILGVVRAILAALSGYLVSRGIGSEELWTALSGGVLSAVVLGWSIKTNTVTLEKVLGLVRNVIASIGGVLMQRGLLTSDQVTQISGLAVTVAPAIWSAFFKTKLA